MEGNDGPVNVYLIWFTTLRCLSQMVYCCWLQKLEKS